MAKKSVAGRNRTAGKSEAAEKSDRFTNRILTVFAVTFLAFVGLVVIYRSYNRASTMLATRTALFIAAGVGVAGILAGVLIHLLSLRGKKFAGRARMGLDLAFFMAALAFCCLFMAFYYSAAVRVLYVAVPAAAVLYMIFLVYQREFFIISLVSACGGFACWALSRLYAGSATAGTARRFAVVCLALTVLIALFFILVRKNGGILKFGGAGAAILHANASYRFIFVTCAAVALALAGALIFGSLAAYYAMFILFGYLFVMAVYYTVKLM